MITVRKAVAVAVALGLAPVAAVTVAGAGPPAGAWTRLPTAPIVADFGSARSIWTGREAVFYGRDTLTARDAQRAPYAIGSRGVAAAFDPASKRWRRLPDAPKTGNYCHSSAVWTGARMLVWDCGLLALDPASGHWRRLSQPPAGGGVVAWTGRELIGWGGGCCGDASADGAAYRPAANRWHRLARSPLAGSQQPIGAWTGHELVILVGDRDPNGKRWPSRLARAAAYDPTRDTWRRISPLPEPRDGASAVWDGHELLVVGGRAPGAAGSSRPARIGFAYDPVTNRWRSLPAMPSGRIGATTVWTGSQLLVYGGQASEAGKPVRSGFAYDPRANRWWTLPAAPLPLRLEPTAVWAGDEMVVWGGVPTATWGRYLATGASFRPTER